MIHHIRKIYCILAVFFVVGNYAADPEFPTTSKLEYGMYETEVTVTTMEQDITSLVTEYYDDTVGRGRVDILSDGNRMTVIYNNDTNEILEINSTTCLGWDIDESEFSYKPIFYGWLNKDPLSIGPTAPLWHAQKHLKDIKYKGNIPARGINCEVFEYSYVTKQQNFTMTFFFAVDTWTTPYKFEELRVPVRILIYGLYYPDPTNSPDVSETVGQIMDFHYFKPSISSWLIFQPPLGIGCLAKKETRTKPTFPKVFMLSAEAYDLVKAEKTETSDVDYLRMWYDSTRLIARLDEFSKTRYTSELYDFNMGVTYRTLNGRTCSMKTLKNSFFEGYDGKMTGHMKEPEEVLDMDGTFYYLGDRLVRGIWTETFESLKTDVTYRGLKLAKLVVTVFYTKENLEVSVTGETETRIPVFYMVTGWDTPTHVALKLQYNVFGFKDVVWPEMYESFELERCFPSMNDKTYFIMIMDVDKDTATLLEGRDEIFRIAIRNQISEVTKVSDMRMPLLTIDYRSVGVFITGLMLERPPAILQFIQGLETEVITDDPDIKPIFEAASKEECAYACVDEEDFICTGFYYCNTACYLKSKDMLDTDIDDTRKNLGKCVTWTRAEHDSSNRDPFLVEALEILEKSVVDGKFKIPLRINETETIVFPVHDVVIGDGPFTGDDNQEVPYIEVMKLAKLKKDDKTTETTSDVTSLNECYRACKNSETMTCASFSYCPQADNKQCLISSVLVVNRDTNAKDTDVDGKCYVYSLKYLDFYTAYPGRVFLITGEDRFDLIKTPEQCAKLCREETKFECRGFEFCRNTKTCVLHSKHIMDLKHENDTYNPLIKPSICTHYAAKFSADYYDMGKEILSDINADRRTELSLDECAKVCTEELKNNCRSFDYCPPTDEYSTDSTCSLSTLVMMGNSTKTTKDKCKHYEKKKYVDDWVKPPPTKKKEPKTIIVNDDSGFTSKGFTGLVVGMLALGLVVGALGFVTYSYLRSRASGEGLTVRFMKSDI